MNAQFQPQYRYPAVVSDEPVPVPASTSAFVIEKGIPLPQSAGRKKGEQKYPWARMEVGDSFFVEASDKRRKLSQVRTRISTAARNYAKTNGDAMKFSTRISEVPRGVRIWRVA